MFHFAHWVIGCANCVRCIEKQNKAVKIVFKQSRKTVTAKEQIHFCKNGCLSGPAVVPYLTTDLHGEIVGGAVEFLCAEASSAPHETYLSVAEEASYEQGEPFPIIVN